MNINNVFCDKPSFTTSTNRRRMRKAKNHQEYADYLARVKSEFMAGTRTTMMCLSYHAFVKQG